MNELLEKKFKALFYEESEELYFSPGRVNIIGEHIDYNGGKVLPMAISLGIYAALKWNDNNTFRCISNGFNREAIISFNSSNLVKNNDFTDYIKGVVSIIAKEKNVEINQGFDIYMYSTLPSGSGLSSSAALELLISHIINDHYNLGLSDLECVIISQRAEREFVGVNCGIMDQFAIGMGKENKVILLDCATLEYHYYDFDLGDSTLVIINTNKPRKLTDSKYNERRAECEEALQILQKTKYKPTLCDYKITELIGVKSLLKPALYKRVLHVITEQKRVEDSIKAMADGNLVNLGRFLKASHNSLADDYEVTGLHLDTIYKSLAYNPLVYGVRMTGAGFGGCAIAIIKGTNENEIKSIMDEANKKYLAATGISFSYYFAKSSDSTRRIK